MRERIGKAEETLDPPADVRTVADLIGWLTARGEDYAYAFAEPQVIRAAIDHAHVKPDAPIAGAREIALLSADDRRLSAMPMTVPVDHPASRQADFDVGARDRGADARPHRYRRGRARFTGICRGSDDGAPIAALTLEHYPGMAEAEIGRHVDAGA